MDIVDLVSKIWPIAVGFVTLVIVLAKMDARITTIEDKVKSLFELWNHHIDKGKD
jgi:hypothetical protein